MPRQGPSYWLKERAELERKRQQETQDIMGEGEQNEVVVPETDNKEEDDLTDGEEDDGGRKCLVCGALYVVILPCMW